MTCESDPMDIARIERLESRLDKLEWKVGDLKHTLSTLDSQTIRLMFGEMTSQEMRTVKAVLSWVKGQL